MADPAISYTIPEGLGIAEKPPEKISDAAGYDALPGGQKFLDPEGQARTKPYTLKDTKNPRKAYEDIPEGAQFYDPEGVLREKPKYDSVSFAAQSLWDMAANDKERFNVLAHSYGADKVKKTPDGEFYVEMPEGKRLKPGSGSITPVGGFLAASAAPTVGGVGGGILGGAAGSVAPGAGTAAGAIGGSAAGMAAGQGFNDMIMALAGVYDRSPGEEAKELALAGAGGAAGEGLGRGIAAAAPSAKALVEKVGGALPATVGKYVGATETPEAADRALRLAEQGVRVPPSAWMPEAPYLKKTVEEFDPVFRQQNVLGQSAREHYEKEGGRLLNELGVPQGDREALTEATKPVTGTEAGQAVLTNVRNEMAVANAQLKAAKDAVVQTATTQYEGMASQRESMLSILEAAAKNSREAAKKSVDAGLSALRHDADQMIAKATEDRHPGALWETSAEAIDKLWTAMQAHAEEQYGSAYAASGKTPLMVAHGAEEAKKLMADLPEQFASYYPDLARRLAQLAKGEAITDETGKPLEITLEQLHKLRTVARAKTNPLMPFADQLEGVKRNVAGIVNRIMHDPAQPEDIKTGVRIIDAMDKEYASERGNFERDAIHTLISKMRTGSIDDAGPLARVLFDRESTANVDLARQMLGPELWKAVQAADVQSMVNASLNSVREVDAGRFANQVVSRIRNGTFDRAYDKDFAGRIENLANRVLAIDGSIPLEKLQGDNVATLLQRATDYAEDAKRLAAEDPLGELSKELNRIDRTYARQSAADQAARRREPLGELAKPTVLASEAADHILGKPDLIIAAEAKFGRNSPEFEMLRRTYAHRLLQRSLGSTTRLMSDIAKMPEDVQELVFPGVSRRDAVELAKDMEFLAAPDSDTGGSIAAMERVLHPLGSVPVVGGILKKVPLPGADAVGRFILGKYYSLLSYGATHPGFVKWVVQGMKSTPEVRAETIAAVQQAAKVGGMIGAGAAGEAFESGTGSHDRRTLH